MNIGSVVKARYSDMDGVERSGYFVILYTEYLDNMLLKKHNVIGVKITSQNQSTDQYSYRLPVKYYSFLSVDSYVLCNKMHTLNISQVDKVIADLPRDAFVRIMANVQTFLNQVSNQMLNHIR